MHHERYTSRPLDARIGEPFPSAEEAWFWYSQCQLARNEGARWGSARSGTARPCDPDDIYRAVDGLYRSRTIRRDHVAVLGRFGARLTPPDPHGDGAGQAALWAEALDRLATALKRKGIVS